MESRRGNLKFRNTQNGDIRFYRAADDTGFPVPLVVGLTHVLTSLQQASVVQPLIMHSFFIFSFRVGDAIRQNLECVRYRKSKRLCVIIPNRLFR